jgi:predicted dehydrogenase
MAQPSRLVLIGAGVMGRHHLSVAMKNPAFDVVGVADPTPAMLEPYREKGIAIFTDHRAMLKDLAPDCAIVAAPNAYHVPIALDCIERGVVPLVEKPVGDTMQAVRSLKEAVSQASVPVLVGHHRRHNPLLKAAAAHIAGGQIGNVVAAIGLWLRRKPDEYFREAWKKQPPGGGVLLINTIHDFDCLRMLCGEIRSVQAMTSNAVRGNAVEDTAAITIRFANGALGTITVSDATIAPWCWEMTSREDPRFAHVPENSYYVCGTKGSLAVPTLEAWSNEPNGGREASFTRQRLYYVAADSMTEQMAHFARVVRREEKPLVTVEDAASTLAATLAVTRSAETGSTVTLEEMLYA